MHYFTLGGVFALASLTLAAPEFDPLVMSIASFPSSIEGETITDDNPYTAFVGGQTLPYCTGKSDSALLQCVFTHFSWNPSAASYLVNEATDAAFQVAEVGAQNAAGNFYGPSPVVFSDILTALSTMAEDDVPAEARPMLSSVLTHALALQNNAGPTTMASSSSQTGTAAPGSGSASASRAGSAAGSGAAAAASATHPSSAAAAPQQINMAVGAVAGVALGIAGLAVGL